MVTNIPSRCIPYWNNYEEAKTTREKIKALEELIACIPKHKGTEKLLKDFKVKLAKLRAELTKEMESKPRPRFVFSVSKKGDAQIVLLGTPYSGKTSLVNSLCNASYVVGRPTSQPQEGIFKWEGCEFQIVDMPPILSADIDRTPNGRSIMGIAYNSDVLGLVVDATQDLGWQIDVLIGALKDSNIILKPPPPIRVKRLPRGGIMVSGIDYSPFSIDELKEILRNYKIINCIVEFHGPVSEYDIFLALNPRIVFKKAIVILTKLDLVDDKIEYIRQTEKIIAQKKHNIPIVPYSIKCPKCMDNLGKTIFKELDLIRVWTKKDGIVSRERAIVLKSPATVRDVCEKIHTHFLKKFRYAVVERPSDKIKRKNVGIDYQLKDGDIITIYTRD